VDDLAQKIAALETHIEGITLSGGEPLQQRPPLLALLRHLRQRTRLSVVVFTGYTWDEVQRLSQAQTLLALMDVLITGRYVESQDLDLEMGSGLEKGSDPLRQRGQTPFPGPHKTVHHLTARYSAADLEAVPATEVIIAPGGEIQLTGIDPLQW
jgi:anaerobic ribonucleoside-triphosphate reductase activating protein